MDWTLSISVSQRAVLRFVSRGCWRDTAWRRGLLSLLHLLCFAFPCSCFGVVSGVCVCAGASTGALPAMWPRMGSLSVTGLSWSWLQPSQGDIGIPKSHAGSGSLIFSLCAHQPCVCSEGSLWWSRMDACAPGCIPAVVPCFLLCAHSRASVRLLPGGLSRSPVTVGQLWLSDQEASPLCSGLQP